MKIILTELELQDALTNGAPVPPDYAITAVDFQKYSNDFCTLTLARADQRLPLANAAPAASCSPPSVTPLFDVAHEAA